MASSAKWKTTGQITKSNFSAAIGIGIQGVLNDVGMKAVTNMRSLTKPHEATGELTDSIMYVTQGNKSNRGSRAKESPDIDTPADKYTVVVGSAAEHAIYRETESGIHLTDDGSDLFIARMKEWYKLRFRADPDLPENKNSFYGLLSKVRNTKTVGVPFVKPTKDMIVPYAKMQFQKAINTALKAKK